MSKTYYLSLGSNISPETHIHEASKLLETLGEVRGVSPVYLTEPVGMNPGAAPFHNLCVALEFDSSPGDLKSQLQEIENTVGRKRTQRGEDEPYAPRTIDIDILFSRDEAGEDVHSKECAAAAYVVYPLSDLIDPPGFLEFDDRAEWRNSVDADQILEQLDYDWPEEWASRSVPGWSG